VKFVVHDHCSICRRISGAAFVTWVGVLDDRFKLLSGAASLTTFASTAHARRQFCVTCGTVLFFRSSRWPGEVHLTLATVDEPHELRPTAHVFFSDKASWLDVDAYLPRRGGASGVEPLE
jgi:hypothetical protein